MKASIVTITPDNARHILNVCEFKNRKINDRYVGYLSELMENNKWVLNGEPIIISNKQNLIDGQHRLLAVIKCEIPQRFHIVEGVDEKDSIFIDTGKTRSSADVLRMHNVKDESVVASMIRTYKILSQGIFYKASKSESTKMMMAVSNEAILNEYQKRPEFWDEVKYLSVSWYRSYQKLIPKSEIGGIFALVFDKLNMPTKINETDIYSFFHKLCNYNFRTDLYDPLKALTKTLTINASSIRKMTSTSRRALIIKTWNAYYNNKPIRVIRYQRDEPFPTPEPIKTRKLY